MAQASQRIAEYLLDTRVGGGAFGEVWRAHHHVWVDQLVAIKIPSDPQYLRNLKTEGAAIHGLLHPNIVRAMGFDPYGDPPYLTMEYIPGTSLRPLIQKKSLSPADVVSIMRQVMSGLKYAHDHKIIHRDIKPENVLVHERALTDGFALQGVIKITDFGLGKSASNTAGSIAYSASMNLPAGRDIAGTLDYMSPEQRAGSEPDPRADIYACGVMLYELLTGERPAGTDLPSDLNKSVPKYLDEIFRRSYSRLDKRYASADQFLAALPPALKTQVTPPPLPRTSSAYSRNSAAVVACPQCRKPIEETDQFCMHCGVQVVPVVRRCNKCGAYPDRTDRYCIFCGETLAAEPVTA